MKILSAQLKPKSFTSATSSPSPVIVSEKLSRNTAAAYGRAPEFLGNRFVYAVISQRSHGLSIGINLNPDKCCNFDCAYCEINREVPGRDSRVDLDVLAAELENLLSLTFAQRLREFPYFQTVPTELLELKGVAL